MVLGHCGTNPSFSKANIKYLYRNKVQMCSLRDVKHKTMSKRMWGLPQEGRMFLRDMMEMCGSNNCFTLKLPSETVPPWHRSLCGEMAFFKALLSQDTADVYRCSNWNSG